MFVFKQLNTSSNRAVPLIITNICVYLIFESKTHITMVVVVSYSIHSTNLFSPEENYGLSFTFRTNSCLKLISTHRQSYVVNIGRSHAKI
jgi:hypothetical protein